jgi:hypothetical protein
MVRFYDDYKEKCDKIDTFLLRSKDLLVEASLSWFELVLPL